jgi:hypothetical protein
MPRFAQAFPDETGDALVIFDQQDFHMTSMAKEYALPVTPPMSER